MATLQIVVCYKPVFRKYSCCLFYFGMCVFCVYTEAVLMWTVFIVCTLSIAISQDSTAVTPEVTSSVTDVSNVITTVSAPSRTVAYLNSSVPYGSPLNLSVVLDIRGNFELSFRTCLHGSLLSQIGGDEQNLFQLLLSESGSLNVSWSSAAASESVLLGRDLNDNQWYKFVWTYQDLGNGSVTVSVQQNATVLFSSTVTASDHGLWNVSLHNGSKLLVGDRQFEGCLIDGPQMWFSSADEVDDSAGEWHHCPNDTVCDQVVNSCASSPCANNGRLYMYLSHVLHCRGLLLSLFCFAGLS